MSLHTANRTLCITEHQPWLEKWKEPPFASSPTSVNESGATPPWLEVSTPTSPPIPMDRGWWGPDPVTVDDYPRAYPSHSPLALPRASTHVVTPMALDTDTSDNTMTSRPTPPPTTSASRDTSLHLSTSQIEDNTAYGGERAPTCLGTRSGMPECEPYAEATAIARATDSASGTRPASCVASSNPGEGILPPLPYAAYRRPAASTAPPKP